MELTALKEQLTLAQVLRYYGLKPDKHLRLHCPFHEDKTPSMQVYYKTHTAYCFSSHCTTHGKAIDVIDFVMYKENCSKHEAILKCQAMIQGTIIHPPIEVLTHTAILTKMFTYFKNAVHNSKPAQDYIKGRGLDPLLLDIGYNTGQFHHGARKDEVLIKSCLQVGLLSNHDRLGRTGEISYKPFAKYGIVFALRNASNQVSGLYFRSTINEDSSKHFYLKDSEGLYPGYPDGATQRLILTEAIIDAASLLQVKEVTSQCSVLAAYGTNRLTPEHIQAITALKDLQEIIFAFDGDEAGNSAAKKYADQLKALLPGISITTLQLPSGEDVNSVAVTHDSTIFPHLLATRTDIFTDASFIFSSASMSPGGFLSSEKKDTEATTIFATTPTKALVAKLVIESSVETKKSVVKPSPLDTTNPYKIRYSSETAHYYVQGGLPKSTDSMKVMLVIESNTTALKARNKIDLYEDKPVERLCKEVAEKLSLRKDLLEADLYQLTELLDQHREQAPEERGATPQLPILTVKERQEGERFAKQPKLIKRLNELLGSAGIVGEERSRIFLLLIAISHKMPEPLHALIQGSSGSGKTRLLKQVTDCMPPESVTKLTRLSDKVLYNYPERYFMNRLLCLEDIDGLSEEAEFAFRELQSNGELNSATSIKLDNGQITSGQKTVKGPIASLACTTRGEWYEDNMSRVFLIAVDESAEQTRRIITYQNQKAAGLIDHRKEQEVKAFIQRLVRLLQPYEVINPYAGQLHLPEAAHKIRRLNDLFQHFIKMITILHQYQRKKDDRQRLITELDDVALAIHIMFESIVLKVDELDGSLRQFFEQLKTFVQQKGRSHAFTRFEIKEATGVGKTQQHHYMNQLVALEYLQQSGFANRGYTYKIVRWDNYTALKETIQRDLLHQLEALKTEHPRTPDRTPASAATAG